MQYNTTPDITYYDHVRTRQLTQTNDVTIWHSTILEELTQNDVLPFITTHPVGQLPFLLNECK